jgi:hypothetical protein
MEYYDYDKKAKVATEEHGHCARDYCGTEGDAPCDPRVRRFF